MEGVNIRAEQLSDICADSLIPKRQISLLNKKFKLVSYQLEQVQAPEEKGWWKFHLFPSGHCSKGFFGERCSDFFSICKNLRNVTNIHM